MPSKTNSWGARQEAIREILDTEEIRSQTDLLTRLHERGFPVTQSSVSRDLQEMRVAKVGQRYFRRESLLNPPTATDGLYEVANAVKSYQAAGPHLLILHTPPGLAGAVGLAIDRAEWPEVVGTIAGDDTVFIATLGRREQAKVEAHLEQLVIKGE